jgi:signal transduction histidine kinase
MIRFRIPTNAERIAAKASATVAGLGLGLYIAHAIVCAHGGTLAVSSAPEDGTTFTITLPRAAGAPTTSDADRAAAASD